ncbi:MAG: hypothetical protein BM559_01585 [Roseobacter sp. MedPE-SWchi]|nr:MAG: hypothetical protein BM559_01585 [Roseobacter sp. MedPE-SWchi]
MPTKNNYASRVTTAGELIAPAINLEKNISGAMGDFIDKETAFFILKAMIVELDSRKEAPELVSCLLGMANELIQSLEHQEIAHITAINANRNGPVAEAPLLPPRIPPLPPLVALRRLSHDEQARFLDKRASDLMREIEGLRLGYYKAPEYRLDYRMIEQARRRYRKLRDTAMKLGHWTDGRWEATSEETHLV